MSLQINLSSRELTQAYQDVLNGRDIDWAIFTYDKGTNDLKVQATGDGGLDELQEEFSDGRYVSCDSYPLPSVDSVGVRQNAICICTCQGPECMSCTLDLGIWRRN